MLQSLHSGDQEFLSSLLRSGPSGISDLCSRLNVTATAVRQRLQRLQALGLVERVTVRADRGRPHHVYDVSAAGRGQLSQSYADLATLLWDELQNIEEEPVRTRVLGRIRQAMVDQLGRRVTAEAPAERMRELATALAERGHQVEAESSRGAVWELPVLREHACPYHEIASRDSSICELEQAVFAEVIGSPLELTHCCQRGDRVCEFEPSAAGRESGATALQ
ncbi:MAG: MarR family transcriptional regulator [Planctomyces sp.]|nr:MarR family transcriptional regulator [Planctomyces sp.]